MKAVPVALVATWVLLTATLIGARDEEPQASGSASQPADPPPDKAAGTRGPGAGAGPEGFLIQSESGDYKVQIRGYVQFDGRFFPGDPEKLGTDQFLLRRVRPVVQGTVGKYVDFNITPDLGGGTAALQDAYLDLKYSSILRVRVGKFKSPVGLERLQSATALSFVERAFPTALVPNRDVGIQLHGELAGGVLAYAGGVFDGAPDGGSVDLDVNDGKDLAGRIFVSPFKRGRSALKGLGFGVGASTGRQTGPLPAYRSGGQISVVTLLAGVTGDGTRSRVSPQLSFYRGRFALLAEYARSRSWVKKAATEDAGETRARLTGSAWQATMTLSLTGEAASYSGLSPRTAFDPAKGQWGALEVAGRVHGLEIGREAFTAGVVDPERSVREAFSWGLGLNWYLNRNVKQAVDLERATFRGGAAGGADRRAETIVFIRTQVSF
jgi:phosphate-selective porin OprO/OprP